MSSKNSRHAHGSFVIHTGTMDIPPCLLVLSCFFLELIQLSYFLLLFTIVTGRQCFFIVIVLPACYLHGLGTALYSHIFLHLSTIQVMILHPFILSVRWIWTIRMLRPHERAAIARMTRARLMLLSGPFIRRPNHGRSKSRVIRLFDK